MSYNNIFYIYKILHDELKGKSINPLNYNINLKDNKKIRILQKLEKCEININLFFTANIVLSKDFFIEFLCSNKGWNIAMEKYHKFIEILEIKRIDIFKNILIELKKVKKFDFEDRDEFLKLIEVIDYKLFSILYPEDKELIQSLDDGEYFKKIVKMNMILRNMKKYREIKKEILNLLDKRISE